MERKVSFTLSDQEFSFISDAPQEDVEKIIALVREEFASDSTIGRSVVPSTKVLVLGALRVAGRYVELEKEFSRFRSQQESSIDKLIDRVATEIE
jgi:cell division protein ZapA